MKKNVETRSLRRKKPDEKPVHSDAPATESGLVIPGLTSAALRDAAGRYDAGLVKSEARAAGVSFAGWPMISVRGGVFRLGSEVLGTSIEVVILASVLENVYWKEAWEPGVITPPTCQAVGRVGQAEADLAPTAGVEKQSSACTGCARNEFVRDGKKWAPKECTNYIRLAVLNSTALRGDLATPAVVRVAPTSKRSWSAYANALANYMDADGEVLSLSPATCVTRLSLLSSQGRSNAPFVWSFDPISLVEPGTPAEMVDSYRKQAEEHLTRTFEA